jgi:leucine-rich repeat-containing protein 49
MLKYTNIILALLKMEKDDRFFYFLKYGVLRRFEGEAEIIFVEIPQIPKKVVVYRRPSYRQKTYDRLYLNNMDLPHIPLFEGEENLKLLSLENNCINKIDHLVSLNNLLYLNLYSNKIYEIENLHTVPKLRAIMLGKNQIEKIKQLNWLVDLEVLDLHSNRIKVLENLSMLKKLRLLNLANNQITNFNELVNNKNLEEINLRKNLIVSIPKELCINLEKVKKLNLGKNMISKLEFLLEIKKLKSLTELIVEDNPVLVLKESSDLIKGLPIKVKNNKELMNEMININNNNLLNKRKDSNQRNQIESINSTLGGFKENSLSTLPIRRDSNSIKDLKRVINNESNNTISTFSPVLKKSNLINRELPEILIDQMNTPSIKEEDVINLNNDKNIFANHLDETSTSNIISHIEKEWHYEFKYICDNGYNGYNTKRLKESKIVSGHAELEGNNKLNIYGNALEVLDQEEFYQNITIIHFEYFNIDLISNRKVLEKLKLFKKITKLIFNYNNIHSFYQMIKFEEFNDVESIFISNNEICAATLLKPFLIYRFQNLKFFNEIELTQKDIINAKKVFEYFDKCISQVEGKQQSTTVKYIEPSFKEAEIINQEKNIPLSSNLEKEKIKVEFFNFCKNNLMDVLEEMIDE